MKLIITLFIAMSLAGCATPADRRKQPPNIETSSNKSAKEVTVCIADKWENFKSLGFPLPPVNTSIKANGYSVMVAGTSALGISNTFILVDVLENQSGSTTKFYKANGPGYGDLDRAVKDCQ
jgi:hypothetical protein